VKCIEYFQMNLLGLPPVISLARLCLCVAMRIQLSEDIYDYLVNYEPKFIMVNRGLRLVLVSNLTQHSGYIIELRNG